jgi:hypothetical protein
MSARTKAKRLASRLRFVERVAMWPGRCGRRRTLCRECKGPLGYCVYPCQCAPLRPDEQDLLDDFILAPGAAGVRP